MRHFTTEHTVYNFDELSPEAQAHAIDYFRDTEEFTFLGDDMAEELYQMLANNKITYDEPPKVYFSLGYSQGDGAMFEGTVYWKAWRAKIKQSGHYYHYNSKDIELTSIKTDKEAPDKTYDEFNELYIEICSKLEKYGYSIIEAMTSDEYIIDMINANEYEFDINGGL